jgi:DNA-binding MarR family transcriptional regulator
MMQASDKPGGPLVAALYGLMHAMKSAKHDDPVDRSAIIILSRLQDQGALRLSDLAGDLGLDVSTMSRHARSLEERGLIAREGDPDDGRAVRLTIAGPGRTVLAAAQENRRIWLEESLAGWTDAERDDLTATLNRLTAALAPSSTTTRSNRSETSA